MFLRKRPTFIVPLSVRSSIPDGGEEDFYPAIIMDKFLIGHDSGVLAELERTYASKVENLDDYLSLLDKAFSISIERELWQSRIGALI